MYLCECMNKTWSERGIVRSLCFLEVGGLMHVGVGWETNMIGGIYTNLKGFVTNLLVGEDS